jgi:hypothetical protein
MNLRDEITSAVKEASISGFQFVRLTEWGQILDRIAERFLKQGRQDLNSIWLWSSFRDPIDTVVPDDTIKHLRTVLDSATSYWFIASDEEGKYWVADATGEAIVRTIEEMYAFEYYICNKGLGWILCENHHNTFIRSSPPIPTSGEQIMAHQPA